MKFRSLSSAKQLIYVECNWANEQRSFPPRPILIFHQDSNWKRNDLHFLWPLSRKKGEKINPILAQFICHRLVGRRKRRLIQINKRTELNLPWLDFSDYKTFLGSDDFHVSARNAATKEPSYSDYGRDFALTLIQLSLKEKIRQKKTKENAQRERLHSQIHRSRSKW